MELFGVFSGKELNHVYPNGNEVCGVDIVYVSRDYTGSLHCTDGEAIGLGFYPVDRLPQPISPMNAKQIEAYIHSDRSKFEILRRISRSSSYCQELAREMNLTTATISRHMGLLLDAGLVRARRGENRIYYDLNRDAVTNLCDVVCGVLLQQ